MNQTRCEQTKGAIADVRATVNDAAAHALADHAEWLLTEIVRLNAVIDANQTLREHAEETAKDAIRRRDHWENNSTSWKRTADELSAKLSASDARFEHFKTAVLEMCKPTKP